jgi:hypothetical protein
MNSGIDDLVKISPRVWPGKQLDVQPGDLSIFVPMGSGIAGPIPVMPWDDLTSALSRPGYYSYHAHSGHPFLGAPSTEAAGGIIYFDGDPQRTDVEALLRLLEVYSRSNDYAVFSEDATNPQDERYLTQIRIVSKLALRFMFQALSSEEYEAFPEQPLSVGELVWRFIEGQQQIWGKGYSRALMGAMGGDGDWANETLAFGFMVENAYHHVYRLWSRAWLVTK